MGESKHTPGPWRHQRPNDVDRRHKVMSGPEYQDLNYFEMTAEQARAFLDEE